MFNSRGAMSRAETPPDDDDDDNNWEGRHGIHVSFMNVRPGVD